MQLEEGIFRAHGRIKAKRPDNQRDYRGPVQELKLIWFNREYIEEPRSVEDRETCRLKVLEFRARRKEATPVLSVGGLGMLTQPLIDRTNSDWCMESNSTNAHMARLLNGVVRPKRRWWQARR